MEKDSLLQMLVMKIKTDVWSQFYYCLLKMFYGFDRLV